MKCTTWIAAAILTMLPACSNAAGDPPPAESTVPATTQTSLVADALERFEAQELGFAISYPEGWTVEPSMEEGLVQFTAPPAAAGLTPNFNVSTGLVSIPAVDYYQGATSRLAQNLPNVEILEDVDILVGGVPGHGVSIVSTESGLAVGISQILVLLDGRAWEVTFLAEAGDLEELSPLVTEIFQSFEFLRR